MTQKIQTKKWNEQMGLQQTVKLCEQNTHKKSNKQQQKTKQQTNETNEQSKVLTYRTEENSYKPQIWYAVNILNIEETPTTQQQWKK